jgi:hypothetical protein
MAPLLPLTLLLLPPHHTTTPPQTTITPHQMLLLPSLFLLLLLPLQVLEYFSQVQVTVPDDHIIFGFEKSMELGVGDLALLDQLCVALGYTRSTPAQYLTGENRELIGN